MKKTCFTLVAFLVFAFGSAQETYTYAIKGKDTLKLDVYRPIDFVRGSHYPTLIWMHGGGFSGGKRDNKDEKALCKKAAEQGYVAVSISYRLLRKNTESFFGCDCTADEKVETFKQAAIDYLDAVGFVLEHKNEFGVDENKLIAGGSSAGAEATLSAVYMKNYYTGNRYKQISFAGVFALAGAVTSLDEITSKTAIPTVLFHGIADNLVPYSKAAHHYCNPNDSGYLVLNGSDKIIHRLEDLNASYLFYSFEKGRHEISGVPFGELAAVFDFFNQTLKGKHIQHTIYR